MLTSIPREISTSDLPGERPDVAWHTVHSEPENTQLRVLVPDSLGTHTLTVNCENVSLEVVPILLNPRVQTILLTRNKIRALSQSLVFYSDLRKLDISDNEIDSLGRKNFKEQENLTELRVSNNSIKVVEGTSLQGLVGVKMLYLDNNQISHIEDGAFRGLVNLRELNLSKNKIKSLSENSLNALPNLRTLNLSGNKLGSVPSVGLSNLTSLLELDLSDNQISQVPGRAFGGVTSLARLVLDKNNISEVSPTAFSSLCELRRLSIIDNRLQQVPSTALSALPELQELQLSGNLLESLPEDCFKGLTSLLSVTVSRCPRLSAVSSEAFLSTGALKTLVLSHNPRLASLPPAALASLLNLRHLDLTACGLLYLTPTQLPLQQLKSLRVAGNPLHCNCSLVWLSKLTANPNTSVIVDQPACASPPALYGVSVRELGDGGVGCDGRLGMWTIVICVGVALLGLAIIAIFLACRWRRKRKKRRKRDSQDKTIGMWDDMWRPGNHISTTHLPPLPTNGDSTLYPLTTPTRLGPPPRLPPDHPLHHLNYHHHHQGCLQQCPYAALHPVYHPLLHPDHNSTQTTLDTPTLYGDSRQDYTPTHASTITSQEPPLPLCDPPHWYATIGGGGDDSGRESRPLTPLDLTNSPRKVPVTYV
ncbi:Leucine-rich repeat-containing protein 70-like 1 [Homarus americanus]|uniref:Leucine-rich repeat-containing protein 70-like 1 n=1 Tax=Homarus americanus TaxID=6706 RepID=A0A8J5K417_HOMAM|nr:Leucine-rich repeat-containing protein 70-like 1 [Homarus americanus]